MLTPEQFEIAKAIVIALFLTWIVVYFWTKITHDRKNCSTCQKGERDEWP